MPPDANASHKAELWETAMSAFRGGNFLSAISHLKEYLQQFSDQGDKFMAHAHLGESYLNLVPETYHRQQLPKPSSLPHLISARKNFEKACSYGSALKISGQLQPFQQEILKDCSLKASSIALIVES